MQWELPTPDAQVRAANSHGGGRKADMVDQSIWLVVLYWLRASCLASLNQKKASDILITSYEEDKKISEITTFSFLGNHLPLHSFPGQAILPFSINLAPGLSASFSNSILLP